MDTNSKRVHYYHADASALGGHIRRPFDKAIPVQAAVSLPPVGGYLEAHGRKDPKESDVNSIVSFETAYSHVSGSVSKKNGAVTTMVTSTVENFNVLDTFTADRMVAQISLDHPPDGYIPKVSLIGTMSGSAAIAWRLFLISTYAATVIKASTPTNAACMIDSSWRRPRNSTHASTTRNPCQIGLKTGRFLSGSKIDISGMVLKPR
jgi:hypothetical protein